MSELEQTYQGKVDFKQIEMTADPGNCEFTKHHFAAVPAFLYIDSKGNIIAQTEGLLQKEQLQQNLDLLLQGKPPANTSQAGS